MTFHLSKVRDGVPKNNCAKRHVPHYGTIREKQCVVRCELHWSFLTNPTNAVQAQDVPRMNEGTMARTIAAKIRPKVRLRRGAIMEWSKFNGGKNTKKGDHSLTQSNFHLFIVANLLMTVVIKDSKSTRLM